MSVAEVHAGRTVSGRSPARSSRLTSGTCRPTVRDPSARRSGGVLAVTRRSARRNRTRTDVRLMRQNGPMLPSGRGCPADDIPGAMPSPGSPERSKQATPTSSSPRQRSFRGSRSPTRCSYCWCSPGLARAQAETAAVRWAARYVAEVRPAPDAREAHLVLSAASALAGPCPTAGREAPMRWQPAAAWSSSAGRSTSGSRRSCNVACARHSHLAAAYRSGTRTPLM